MDILNEFIFGEYDPFWRAIKINDSVIKDFEAKNPELLSSLVYVHENFHWLQLSSSTIGHIISLIPFFYSKTIINAIQSTYIMNNPIEIKNPLMEQFSDSHSFEKTMINRDCMFLNLFLDFMLNTNNKEQIMKHGADYNNALFSVFDIYLQNTKERIISLHGKKYYDDLVKANREFWDKKENYGFLFIAPNIDLLGFKDLIECSARIIEIKYYEDTKNKYKLLNIDKYLEKEIYLFNSQYFQPLSYIKLLFTDNNIDNIFDFLLICIHISINPTISPAYTNMYIVNNSLADIHPGMRFIKILGFVKNKYQTIKMALASNDLYNEIINGLKWKNDIDNFKDFKTIYGGLFSQFELSEEKGELVSNIFKGEKVYDIDYLMFKFYKFSKIKSEYHNFFIDMSLYLTDPDLIQKYIEIDKKVHCPIIFDEKVKKFRVNISGMTFSSPDENGKLSIVINLKKDANELIQTEYLNYIITNLFYELDKQLLYSNNKIDLSIVDKFDIGDDIKKTILELYKERRKIKTLNV